MPLISFIVTYHNEPYCLLRECLESVLALPLGKAEREVVVVDDGSERSVETETKSLSPDIIYIRQENQGLSAARNRGIEVAKGAYLQFVDADDALLPKSYSRVIDTIREHGADMVMFGLSVKSDTGATPTMCFRTCSGVEFLLHHNMRAAACGYVFSRKRLGSLRFMPGILHEDELFTPQIILAMDTVCHTLSPAYYYRQRTSTITHRTDDGHIRRRLRDLLTVLRLLRDKSEHLASPMQEALNRRVHQLTMDYTYNVWSLTHDAAMLRQSVKTLRSEGFLPLPLKFYTCKYLLFAVFSRML